LQNSPTGETLTIGGAYTAGFLGGNVTLGFAFQQTTSGGVETNSLNLSGSFSGQRGIGTLDWSLKIGTGGAIAICLDDVVTMNNGASVHVWLNVNYGGGNVNSVAVLLGVTF
jgi:hypothetical protein